MEDITARLRLSGEPESVERERVMADQLYGTAIAVGIERGDLSRSKMERIAKQAIEAACVFWQEWDISVLTPDIEHDEQCIRLIAP